MNLQLEAVSAETMPRNDTDDPGMIQRLHRSFETFIGVTEELKEAYDRLRERADAMDLKLQEANRDLSEKVQELDGLTRRLNDLLQSLPSAVVAVDRTGRVTHFNRAAERLLGLEADAVLGLPVSVPSTLNTALVLGASGDRLAAKTAGEERTVVTADGRRLVVTSKIAQLEDAQGRPAGRIEILNDLTETDRLRREVHRLDTLAAMGEMAGAVAHQIRNPLNGVEGFASLLQRRLVGGEGSSEDTIRYAEKIVHGVREVNAVIQGMLMLAKSEPLARHPVDIDRLACEVAGRFAATENPDGVCAEVRHRKGATDTVIDADALKVKQVLLNLVHNALAAVNGREGALVRISILRRTDGVVIRVSDNGSGIDAEAARKIFRPFFTTREDGTGLGLAVASKIVELHGGRIRVRSIHGSGTVFRIFLPGPILAGCIGDTND